MHKSGCCPICKKQRLPDFSPFCSSHCKNVDLNRWLSGLYAIPGESVSADEEREDFSEDI